MAKPKKKSNAVMWGAVAVGGLAVAGVVAVAMSSGGGDGPNGYQILPNCQGLVITDEGKALEYVRNAARSSTSVDAIMEGILGKCGFAAITTPAFVPTGRFVFLAIRAAFSELVKKGYSVPEAAKRITEAATNLTKMGVNLGDIPLGLEP